MATFCSSVWSGAGASTSASPSSHKARLLSPPSSSPSTLESSSFPTFASPPNFINPVGCTLHLVLAPPPYRRNWSRLQKSCWVRASARCHLLAVDVGIVSPPRRRRSKTRSGAHFSIAFPDFPSTKPSLAVHVGVVSPPNQCRSPTRKASRTERFRLGHVHLGSITHDVFSPHSVSVHEPGVDHDSHAMLAWVHPTPTAEPTVSVSGRMRAIYHLLFNCPGILTENGFI